MKRLFLDFVNQTDGSRRRIVIPSPKANLTADQVSQAMDSMISLGVVPQGFVKDRAAIVETSTNEFFNLI